MTRRLRLPPTIRLWLKLRLTIIGMFMATDLANDPEILARARKRAAWHRHWLMRYDRRLRALQSSAPPMTALHKPTSSGRS